MSFSVLVVDVDFANHWTAYVTVMLLRICLLMQGILLIIAACSQRTMSGFFAVCNCYGSNF